jgi:hypothetical protein
VKKKFEYVEYTTINKSAVIHAVYFSHSLPCLEASQGKNRVRMWSTRPQYPEVPSAHVSHASGLILYGLHFICLVYTGVRLGEGLNNVVYIHR